MDYDLEKESTVRSLFKLYLGEEGIIKQVNFKHQMCHDKMRLSILSFLMKSTKSTEIFPASLQVAFDLLSDKMDHQKGARNGGFDWLAHLHRNGQIKPPTVPLIVDRLIVLLNDQKPNDRIMSILPLLADLNQTPFVNHFTKLFRLLLDQLKLTPAATLALLTVAKLNSSSIKRDEIISAIIEELTKPPPLTAKWFVLRSLVYFKF